MTINKDKLRTLLLSLEAESIEDAEEHYDAFVEEALAEAQDGGDRVDQAQATSTKFKAAQAERSLHEHEKHLEILEGINFSAKTVVESGAVVNVNGRTLVVSVPTRKFELDGVTMIGVSPAAPLVKAMLDLEAGASFKFHGKKMKITSIA